MGRQTMTESRATPDDVAVRLTLSLLDGFELRDDDRVIPLPLATQRVVAFLALHDRPLLRGFVAGQLWPDVTERRAAASLRSALWRLGASRAEVVTATAEHVAVADTLVVDAAELRRAARRLFAAGSRPDPDTLDADLFAGVLLPDWYDEWVVLLREQVRQLSLHALEQVAEAHRAAGDHARALDAALEAVRLEPLRESAHRVTARIHLSEGNHGEALRRYDTYRALLRAELDLEPSGAFRRLLADGDVAVTAG